MQQTLGNVFKAAQQNDLNGFLAQAAERYIQHSPDLPDGWKPVWDLLAKRPAGFSSKQMKWLGPDGFLDNGRYLLMLREVNRGDGTPPSKIVDIMKFDNAGKYTEHWDIRQALSTTNESTASETDAAEEYLKTPVSYSAEIEESNKQIVASFLELGFNQERLNEAIDKYLSKSFIQHSPHVAPGLAGMKAIADAGTMPPLKHDIQLIVAQNDIVVVFSRVTAKNKQLAVVDIHRVRDGKLVEHWDVIQNVPSAESMPHTNGMFLRPTSIESGATAGAIELISYKVAKGTSITDAMALDRRVKQEYVVKQPGYISRHTGVTEGGTIYVQVMWDSIKSVEASQQKGMTSDLMGSYMRVMDPSSIKFQNITINQ